MPFEEADHLHIPLLDGRVGIAQVTRVAPGRVRLFLTRRHRSPDDPSPPLGAAEVIAVRTVDTTALEPGRWQVVGFEAIPRLSGLGPWPPDADAPADDPAVIEAFLNACLGLYPWDGFPDADFFQTMLRPGKPRPEAARLKSQMDLP